MQYKYVFGYLRLSRDDVDTVDESNSIKNQKLLIEQFLIMSGEEFQGAKVQFFIDDGFTGTNYERPEFKKMMDCIKGKSSCCIIVKDLSRLGRDTIDTQDYIEKVFPFMDVRFIAINDYYDSSDTIKSRKDTETKFKNLVNGIYPQICSKKIKQVKQKQAELGKYSGSMPPYGYTFNGDDKTSLLLDRKISWAIRLIIDQRLEGAGYSDIARYMNERNIQTPAEYLLSKGYACYTAGVMMLWTGDMIKRILVNPIYTGAMVNHKSENRIIAVKSAVSVPRKDWIIVPDMHEAIMTPEELEAILEMMPQQTKAVSHVRTKSIFSGKIRCGYCNRMVRIRTDEKHKIKKISCRTKHLNDTQCYKGMYPLDDLKNLVLDLIRQEAFMADDMLKKIKAVNRTLNIPKMRRKVEEYDGYLEQSKVEKMDLYEKFVAGDLGKKAFIEEKEKIHSKTSKYLDEKAALLKKINAAEKKKRKAEDSKLKSLSKYSQIEDLTYEIVQEFIEMIYFYDPEHIEVVWNFKDEYADMSE